MGTESRNIVELEEISTNVTEVPELITVLNNTITELNFILRQFTMRNMDGEIKGVVIPASSQLLISHRLKTIPRQRIILKQEGGGSITDGQFTSKHITLINSGATDANITIIILKE